MRHRKVFTAAAAAALLMSALPAVAAEAPDGRDPERPDVAEEARDKPTGLVSASDGTENAEVGDRFDREALATTLAAEDDEGTYIVQFHSPAAPAYTGGLKEGFLFASAAETITWWSEALWCDATPTTERHACMPG